MAQQDVWNKFELGGKGEFFAYQGGLVKCARPNARPVQGNGGDNDIAPLFRQMTEQLHRDCSGQSHFAAIFQLECHLGRSAVIFNRGPDAIMYRRTVQASRAVRVRSAVKCKGRAATDAIWTADEFKLLPACGAKGPAMGGNDTTTRASFGQRPVERNIKNLADICHVGLVGQSRYLHKAQMTIDMTPPEIFDRKRRHALRERAAGRAGDMFLWRQIADDIAERLSMVARDFSNILVVGPVGRWVNDVLPPKASVTHGALSDGEAFGSTVQRVEEDRLPYPPEHFDLIIAAGTLDSVNDLPGALVQIRRVLKPDGLFLGHMFGAGSLALLKSILLEAEGDRAAPHIHPQIDLRSAADLLVRAGFKLPVADLDVTEVRYANWRSIVSDLRDAGIGNALAGPRRYLGKDIGARLDDAFAHRVDAQGRATEGFTHLYLSGWSPSADQPKPAKRGSGQVSLADFLSKDRSG